MISDVSEYYYDETHYYTSQWWAYTPHGMGQRGEGRPPWNNLGVVVFFFTIFFGPSCFALLWVSCLYDNIIDMFATLVIVGMYIND